MKREPVGDFLRRVIETSSEGASGVPMSSLESPVNSQGHSSGNAGVRPETRGLTDSSGERGGVQPVGGPAQRRPMNSVRACQIVSKLVDAHYWHRDNRLTFEELEALQVLRDVVAAILVGGR